MRLGKFLQSLGAIAIMTVVTLAALEIVLRVATCGSCAKASASVR